MSLFIIGDPTYPDYLYFLFPDHSGWILTNITDSPIDLVVLFGWQCSYAAVYNSFYTLDTEMSGYVFQFCWPMFGKWELKYSSGSNWLIGKASKVQLFWIIHLGAKLQYNVLIYLHLEHLLTFSCNGCQLEMSSNPSCIL